MKNAIGQADSHPIRVMHVTRAQMRFGHMPKLLRVSKHEDDQASVALRDSLLGSGKRANHASPIPVPQ